MTIAVDMGRKATKTNKTNKQSYLQTSRWECVVRTKFSHLSTKPYVVGTQLRIEIHILSLHWMMKNISFFNVC